MSQKIREDFMKQELADLRGTLSTTILKLEDFENRYASESHFSQQLAQADAFLGLPRKQRGKCLGIFKKTQPISTSILLEVFGMAEATGNPVSIVIFSLDTYHSFRKVGADVIDSQGAFGTVWGAVIVVSEDIPEGTVYLLTKGEGNSPYAKLRLS